MQRMLTRTQLNLKERENVWKCSKVYKNNYVTYMVTVGNYRTIFPNFFVFISGDMYLVNRKNFFLIQNSQQNAVKCDNQVYTASHKMSKQPFSILTVHVYVL